MAQAADALAHLTEISTQIQAAVVFDREGTVLGSIVDDDRAGRIAEKALELFRAAEKQGNQELVQLDVSFSDGTVFVVRDADRLIAATAGPEPTVGLVFYDLKTCLRGFGEEPLKPKPKPRRAPAKRTTTTRKKKNDAAS
jgi:predicted regulator of Ras-like GTPase activity (Roadblock/LC7/MglB family)